MVSKAGFPLPAVWRVAIQDAVVADDASLDLVQPHFATELDRLVGLPTTDDGGVRLEDTDDLITCRYLLALKDPPFGLGDNLLNAGKELFQGGLQLLRLLVPLALQGRQHLLRLTNAGLGNAHQMTISLLDTGFGRLAPPTGAFVDAACCVAGTAVPVTEGLSRQLGRVSQYSLGPLDQAAQHPYPIRQQAAVRRMMNVGLDHRAIVAQLASAGELEFTGDGVQPFIEQMQRLRLNQIGPPQQRLVTANEVQINAAEPA